MSHDLEDLDYYEEPDPPAADKLAEAPNKPNTRIWFLPVDSEILDTDGGQLWYGDKIGLGSVADMSKVFTPGSLKFASDPGDDEPLDLGPQTYDLTPRLLHFPHVTVSPALLEGAAQHEKTKHHGTALGLSEQETAEVMDVWLDRFRTMGLAVSYPAIRTALSLRFAGEEWRP